MATLIMNVLMRPTLRNDDSYGGQCPSALQWSAAFITHARRTAGCCHGKSRSDVGRLISRQRTTQNDHPSRPHTGLPRRPCPCLDRQSTIFERRRRNASYNFDGRRRAGTAGWPPTARRRCSPVISRCSAGRCAFSAADDLPPAAAGRRHGWIFHDVSGLGARRCAARRQPASYVTAALRWSMTLLSSRPSRCYSARQPARPQSKISPSAVCID